MTYRKSMSEAIREVQEATIKPYVSISSGGQYNVLDKDSKVVFSTRDGKVANDYLKKNYDKLKEEIQESASQVQVKRDGKGNFNLMFRGKEIGYYHKSGSKYMVYYDKDGDDYDQSDEVSSEMQAKKLAYDNMNEEIQEEVSLQEISDKLKLAVLKKKIKQYKDKVFKKTMSTIKSPLFADYEDVEEGRMKDIFTADQEGKSAEEIAKLMKLPLKTVKGILGEEVFEEQILEFTSDMIKRLKKSYSTMPKTISPEQAKALSKHLDRLDLVSLKKLAKERIPFLTTLARNKVYKKTGKFEEIQEADINVDNVKKDDSEKEKELKIKLDKEKDQDALEKQLIAAQGQINILKQKLENEKNKAIKPEPNPKTGEVPLTVGVAYKHFKKEKEKEKEEVKEAMSDRDKRIQRAKDMIKYYDAQKKAALKGKNKDLAKKMLKNDINEATVVSDISGISIPALKRETAKFNIKVARVTPGGPMGAEYEVTFTGREQDLIAYAKEHFGFDDKPGSFQQLMKHLNMDYVPEEMKKDDAYAIGMAQAKKSMNDEPPLDKKTITKGHEIAKKILNKEEKRVYVESMAGLRKKADKSGMSYSILKKVFDRGMAAWKTGHRPGASQQQWAYARVNSFITKSSGTWGGADKDLAKQVKG